MKQPLVIPSRLWDETQRGLGERSQGRRESACIWAGQRSPEQCVVQEVVFLDDLPGVRGRSLQHRTPKHALDQLFQILREKGLQIVADVHTHPHDWVDLSRVDQRNPIEHRIGLIAIILPDYAQRAISLVDIGVHEYLGSYQWRRLPRLEVQSRLLVPGRSY